MNYSKKDPIQDARSPGGNAPTDETKRRGATENGSSHTDADKAREQRIRELAYRLAERRGGAPRDPFGNGPELRKEFDRASRPALCA